MSGFGPPPGTPADTGRTRPPSYLPPGGLRARRAGGQRPLHANAHKPGIISLRPLTLGDVLDGAAKHVRRSPGSVLGITLVVVAISVVPAVLVAGLVAVGSWYSRLGLSAVMAPGEATGALLVVGVAYAVLLLSGILALPVSQAVMGRPTTAAQVWSAVRPRLWRLVLLDLLLLVVAVVPAALVVLALTAVADAPGAVVVLAGLLALAVVLGWAALVVWRGGLAGPVLVLERRGVRASLQRSWVLSRRGFWRIVGSSATVALLAGLVFSVLGLVLGLLSLLLVEVVGYQEAAFDLALLLVTNVTTIISASVVAPFVASATVLLYVDARMRREGFDVVLQRAAGNASGLHR